MKPDVPAAFAEFDLHRWRRQGAGWPTGKVEFTHEQMAESCWLNMQTAAGELAKAKGIYDGMAPGEHGLQFALGECNRLRAEQRHWKELQEYHRAQAKATARDPRLPREREQGEEG